MYYNEKNAFIFDIIISSSHSSIINDTFNIYILFLLFLLLSIIIILIYF